MGKPGHNILEISRDSHFRSLSRSGAKATWIPSGSPLTPGVHLESKPRMTLAKAFSTLLNLIRNRYDLVVLPAVHENWRYDSTIFKRLIRSCLSFISRNPKISRGISCLLGLRKPYVAILDYADSIAVSESSMNLFPYFDLYFKRNLPAHHLDSASFLTEDNHHLKNSTNLRYLPMGFDLSKYQFPETLKKTVDVFFSGDLNSEARRLGVQILEKLKSEGYIIDIATERLPFDVYLTRLSQAWLTLSPEGYGHHSWRHYESLLAGSVPLINRPSVKLVLCLQDRKTCYYYSNDGNDLREVIVKALDNREEISRIATRGREHVFQHHSKESIARYILNELAYSKKEPL